MRYRKHLGSIDIFSEQEDDIQLIYKCSKIPLDYMTAHMDQDAEVLNDNTSVDLPNLTTGSFRFNTKYSSILFNQVNGSQCDIIINKNGEKFFRIINTTVLNVDPSEGISDFQGGKIVNGDN